jgi:hypothetical protein
VSFGEIGHQKGTEMGEEKKAKDGKLDRGELLMLHDSFLSEMRTSLDFAHRNLTFYVGLLSAILAATLAGLLNADSGNPRVFLLVIAPGLMLWLAEVGYSTVKVFYHRFIDAYFTLLNVQAMLRLNDSSWVSAEVAPPRTTSTYGGFIAQWTGAIDWLNRKGESSLETAKQTLLNDQLSTPLQVVRRIRGWSPELRAVTLRDARTTMWAFELASLLLVPAIIVTGLS